MAGPDVDALLALARRLAGEASTLLVQGLGRVRVEVATKSTTTDMVTEMDRASERLIVDGLRRARPDDAIMGEEGTAEDGTSGVRWLIDPIDGTTNYLYGHPGFAVSIAAEFEGETRVAVVDDPLHHDVFTAVRGRGAERNGNPIQASQETDVHLALAATGFSYEPERRRRQAALLTQVLPELRDVRRMGAASVDLCWVACARVDAFYERGLALWDYAAGALIATEAGAAVGDLDGGPPSTGFVLATAPALFEPLCALLASAGARDA